MDETLLQDAIPDVFYTTIKQTLSLMVIMRLIWFLYCFPNAISNPTMLTRKDVEKKGAEQSWRIIPYLQYGYRESNNSFIYCACSTGCLHNETCNIWTHVFAALYFFNSFLNHSPDSMSKFVALAACYLFSVSTVAHSCSCHSKPVEKIMFRIDRASIAVYFTVFVLVAGYQHFLQSRNEVLYFQIFSIVALLAGIASSSMMFFADNARSKLTKVIILSSMVLCVLIPVLRERYYSSGEMKALKDKLVLLHLPTSLGFGALGGFFFASAIPEKYFPSEKQLEKSKLGTFFQYVSSHSMMHVMVFISAWIGYSGQSKWDLVLKYEKKKQ